MNQIHVKVIETACRIEIQNRSASIITWPEIFQTWLFHSTNIKIHLRIDRYSLFYITIVIIAKNFGLKTCVIEKRAFRLESLQLKRYYVEKRRKNSSRQMIKVVYYYN